MGCLLACGMFVYVYSFVRRVSCACQIDLVTEGELSEVEMTLHVRGGFHSN